MSVSLVITVIGDDKPGLVEQLSTTISMHGGNWLESSLSHLAGKFAGILRVKIATERVEALQTALGKLHSLKIVAEPARADATGNRPTGFVLSLVGHDRIGIVREVSQVLAKHRVNVEKLTTHTAPAAMSAEIMFHAHAELLAHATLNVEALQRDLERLADDLIVEFTRPQPTVN